jgi:regulatory protein
MADDLERAALTYLLRYASSIARVRAFLERHVRRDGGDLEAIDEVVEKLVRLGYLDDERFAVARARALRRRGSSSLSIAATLAKNGVDRAIIDRAIADEAEELEAARAFVRRRRLGPHRAEEERSEKRERDLAALARAGFSYEVASRALEL